MLIHNAMFWRPPLSFNRAPEWYRGSTGNDLGSFPVGTGISINIAAVNADGTTPEHTIVSGSIPDGLTLNRNGVLTGFLAYTTSVKNHSFTVKATNAQGDFSTSTFSVLVSPTVASFNTVEYLGTPITPYNISTPWSGLLPAGTPVPQVVHRRYSNMSFSPNTTGKYYLELTYSVYGIYMKGASFYFGFCRNSFDFLNFVSGYRHYFTTTTTPMPANTLALLYFYKNTNTSPSTSHHSYIDGVQSAGVAGVPTGYNFGLLIDFDNKIFTVRSDNVKITSITIPNFSEEYRLAFLASGYSFSSASSSGEQMGVNLTANFGQNQFLYPIPTGYTTF